TRGMRPNDGLRPTMPQQLAGMRTEPAMSVPRARYARPAATAAAEPPLEPPAVRSRSHGVGVVPNSLLSVTRAYHALYERWRQELADYEAHLPAPENACGVAVEVDGRVRAVDLFDKPDTLRRLWPGLAKGYILAALAPGAVWGRETGVREFL